MKTKTIIRDQNGGAAVEFGLILPLFILLLFGIVEFGLLLYNKQIITNAGREGARAGVVAGIPRLTDAQIQAVVNKYANNYLVTFGTGTINFNPPISPLQANRTGYLFGTNLTVSVTYPYDFLVLSGFGFGPITLRAQTIMKME
jgi:Flp pilus assembly protein TadG